MGNISRRAFVGGVAGLTGAISLGAGCKESSESARAVSAGDAAPIGTVTEQLKQMIDAWQAAGQQFSGDTLAPDAAAEWQRLIDFYFPSPDGGPVPRSVSVNASNLCPSLQYVDDIVQWVEAVLDQDISFPLRGELATASQDSAAELVQVWTGMNTGRQATDLLALTRNTTEGNNAINNGLFSSGFFDPAQHNVVLWDQNHPTNYDAWYYRGATKGWPAGTIRSLTTNKFSQTPTPGAIPSDPQDPQIVLEQILTLVDANTRVLSMSWQSNECGMVLPMADLVTAVRAKAPDVHIHADCAQTFGVLDLDLWNTGADSAAGSFHKWPCGPKMVGLLYMKDGSAADRFLPNEWGYDEYIKTPTDYGFDPKLGQIDNSAKRFTYLGQQNDATLVSALATALFHVGGFHPNVTPSVIEARARYLGSYTKNALYAALPEIFPGFTPETAYQYILTPTTLDDARCSVFLFRAPEGIVVGDVMKNVYTKYGYAIANLDGLLRISPTFNNTEAQIDGVVTAVIDVIKAMQAGTLPNNTHLRRYS